MKICIFGAGAIGGLMGVQLARAGADVSFIARGAHLAAMREHGARLIMDGETVSAPVRCTSDPRELGVQDVVIITLKAHSLPGVVDSMQPLLGKHTAIVTGVNGIPYWYFYQHGGKFAGTRLASVDPDGSQWTKLGPERAIGCVLPGRGDRRAWRHQACVRQEVSDRRAERRAHAAHSAIPRDHAGRGFRGADSRQYPR